MNAALSMTQQRHSRMRILPRVWATASLSSAAGAVHERVHERVQERVQERKRPHCLRLVKAAAEPVVFEAPTMQRQPDSGLAFYRQYTEAMLRRYRTMSMEGGRVPSLLGRELFRGNVTSCKVEAFDDSLIFVHDVGNCLAALDPGLRVLVRRIAIEGYTHEDTAAMHGISLRTVTRRYAEGLDKLTQMLLDRKLLEPMMAGRRAS